MDTEASNLKASKIDRSMNLFKTMVGCLQLVIGLAVFMCSLHLFVQVQIVLGGALFCFGIANISFGVDRLKRSFSYRRYLLNNQ